MTTLYVVGLAMAVNGPSNPPRDERIRCILLAVHEPSYGAALEFEPNACHMFTPHPRGLTSRGSGKRK